MSDDDELHRPCVRPVWSCSSDHPSASAGRGGLPGPVQEFMEHAEALGMPQDERTGPYIWAAGCQFSELVLAFHTRVVDVDDRKDSLTRQ
jgi:hypothetical protein